MADVICIAGAPGSGKTTIANKLRDKLSFPPYIELSRLREFHLKDDWSNKGKEDEKIAFENLIGIVKKYIEHGYKNIIITDLLDWMVQRLPNKFQEVNYVIISLILEENRELKKRVLETSRDSGYRDYEEAIKRNNKLKERAKLKNEYKIDNTENNPKKTVKKILEVID